MHRFEILCLTPPATADPAIAIAACRAGGLGVLDFESCRDTAAASAAVAALARMGRGPYALRLDGRRPGFALEVLRNAPAGLETLVLVPAEPEAMRALVAEARERGLRILAEVTSPREADIGEAIGARGLIAKGHEAAGRVGDETTFILLQRLLKRGRLPVFAQGGIGVHTAAAAVAGGAAGFVLDAQLYLTRESPLPRAAREAIGRMDGSETICLGTGDGEMWRLFTTPGHTGIEEMRDAARALGGRPANEARSGWHAALSDRIDWRDARRGVWPLGQDAAFAAGFAARSVTVAGVLDSLRAAVDDHLRTARELRPLDQGSPLALSHRTGYPIVQGPMTRVSDTAAFALEVAKAGGLPFLALALMRADEVRRLLEETRRLIGDRSWGVGILGFVPLELRQEQLEAIRSCPPPFALIAGGRPDQARLLEQDGIATYLHVPSPGLLKLFLDSGARRFVFEGRECGGHVGPRSSFVLWNTMVDTLLESLPAHEAAACHVLFAAGIHDALSASMVAAMAAPLAERGAKVGVLLGTAYLFTREAVETGAIVEGFQKAAVECDHTVLLETGPGHATRCAASDFAGTFERERVRLAEQGAPGEEIRNALEALNLGRLRIASKGVERHPGYGLDPAAPKLRTLAPEEQRAQGMFMIGQVAALRDSTLSIAALHHDVAVGGTERLAALEAPAPAITIPAPGERPSDVAIIGMSCLLPKAPDLRTYWHNILGRLDAITEVPADRWDSRLYFDADRGARDKVYSKWGGFLEDTPFDPMRYGITPNSIRSIEPVQLLLLDVVRAGLQDAGYMERPFARQRTSVILGAGGGISDLGSLYTFRSLLPTFVQDPPAEVLRNLPEWTEDSFPGILLNVAAGRVANRFDLGGANFTVDAACASSLAAVYLAVRELETGTSDVAITGGIDTAQNPFMFLCFSKTHAHSARGRCSTFDESADGIAISEGIVVLVMKRLADAERDGDRIYAVIKAVGASSDGRDKGLTAPRPEGQMLAVRRAYAKAGFSPATVGLIEAHGTGTVAGDQAEVTTLKRVFEEADAERQACAIGSVKSMIGHTKCTAGVAGLAKVALALHRKVLPPTLNVEKPNSRAGFPDSPFYVNTESRPWIGAADGGPRRAGVSAFGFGGTNFHAVVEEYRDGVVAEQPAAAEIWPAELFVWRGRSRDEVLAEARGTEEALRQGARPEPVDLAAALWRRAAGREGSALTLAIVASSLEDLAAKLARARERLAAGAETVSDPSGIHFVATPFGREGKVALLFPGQGSQSPNMLRDLVLQFPEMRGAIEAADAALAGQLPVPLSRLVFPPPAFDPEAKRAQQEALTATDVAQPALGACGLALIRLLTRLGLRPDMAAGHSYGEYAALAAAGVFDAPTLARLSHRRGRCIQEAAGGDAGTMAAVPAEPERVAELLRGLEDVWVANLNAPRQTVVSGTRVGVQHAIAALAAQGLTAQPLPVACAFHSPVIAAARERLAEELQATPFAAPAFAVYSNTTALPYPSEPEAARQLLAGHLVKPVRFTEEVLAMHQAGARIFIEAGPRAVLTGLARQILAERPHLAVALDAPGRHGLVQLQDALAQLLAHGVSLDLDRLHAGRAGRVLDLATLAEKTRPAPLPATTWLINGAYARPLQAPKRSIEPAVLRDSRPAAPASPVAPARVAAGAPPLPGALAPPEVAVGDGAAAEVMAQFQDLMSRFLETQRAVMQSYLGGADPAVENRVQEQPLAEALSTGRAVVTAPLRPASPAPASPAQPVAAAPAPAAAPAAPPAAAAGAGREDLTRLLVAVVSERTGYPAEMIDLDAGLEADLGIDSIKRVEVLGALQHAVTPEQARGLQAVMEQLTRAKSLRAIVDRVLEAGSVAVPMSPGGATAPGPAATAVMAPASPAQPVAAAPALAAAPAAPPAAAAGAGREDLTRLLVAVVSERTGYPAEMIDLDAGLEADLGIDSIKRVEVLGALQHAVTPDQARGLQAVMEQLTRAKSLRAIVDRVLEAGGATAPGPAAAVVTAPASPAQPVAAAPAPAAAPAAPPAAVAGVGREDLTRLLVAVVSERTGYPAEMIDLDAGLEADLGIDSIKRVEVLGALQHAVTPDQARSLQAVMEQLTRAKSLRAIVDRVLEAGGAAVPVSPGGATVPGPAATAVAATAAQVQAAAGDIADLPRYLMHAVGSAPSAAPAAEIKGRLFLIVDDRAGLAAQVADLLRGRGARTAILRADGQGADAASGLLAADLSRPQAVEQLIGTLRSDQGPLGGIIHLLPVGDAGPADPADPEAWRLRLARQVKGLYHLARVAGGDLRKTNGFLLAATTLGGDFGIGGDAGVFPGHGGLAGLVKTLALEWPEVRCKVVDFDRSGRAVDRAAQLVSEMLSPDPEVEVGFRAATRLVLRPVAAPLPARDPSGIDLDPEAVVLVTGGARGITAEVACEMARRFRPTLILVGRSPLPEEREPATTAGVEPGAGLKAALIEILRRDGGTVTPAAVDKAMARLLQDRETRGYLAAMRASGSRVRYLQADVRDMVAFAALLDRVYAEYGRIDGVVHGAGVIEDRLIEDKDPASFDRVFDTKTDSAFVLATKLRTGSLRFLAAFTSVAGRFGNRGQGDYAAANEVVNKLLASLDRGMAGRVVGLNWGPWQKTGMASPEVQRRFAERGVQLIPPAAGRRACIDEIERGPKGDIEVILGDGPWRHHAVAAAPAPGMKMPAGGSGNAVAAAVDRPLPLLNGQRLTAGPAGAVEAIRLLDPEHDLFLADHQLDGKPVLPAAVVMELLAEMARRAWPEFEVLGLEAFRVLNGVVLDNGPRAIRLTLRAGTQPDQERLGLSVDATVADPATGRMFYRGTVILGDRVPAPPPFSFAPLRLIRPFPLTVESAYDRWLFHGPVFHGIRSIDGVDEDGITGTLAPSDPARCVRDAGGRWLIDPVVVDSAFQLGILYARSQFDMTPLPARFRSYRRFASLEEPAIRCEFRSRASAGGSVLNIQIALLGRDGRLLGLLEDMELSCSRDLNRLAERRARGPR